MHYIDNLTMREQQTIRSLIGLFLIDSPFVITLEDLQNANIESQSIIPYFANKVNPDTEGSIIRLMPFTILLNRLILDKEYDLHDTIVNYVYVKVKDNDHELNVFMRILFKRGEKIPVEIVKDLYKRPDFELYNQAITRNEYLKKRCEYDDFGDDEGDGYYNEEDEEEDVYYREGSYEDNEELFLENELISFTLKTPLIFSYYQLKEKQCCSDVLISWLSINFKDNIDGLPFFYFL